MSHIFISYSKQNIDFARHLRRLLQDQGFSVWMDETQLGASERWWSSISTNIKSASALIVIMSPESRESDWVEREILVAEDKRHRKPIFPVLLSGEPWSRLANIQFENMTDGINSALTPSFVSKLSQVVPRGLSDTPPQLPGTILPSSSATSVDRSNRNLGWRSIAAIVATLAFLVLLTIYVVTTFFNQSSNTGNSTETITGNNNGIISHPSATQPSDDGTQTVNTDYSQSIQRDFSIDIQCGDIIENEFIATHEEHVYEIELDAGDALDLSVSPIAQQPAVTLLITDPTNFGIAISNGSLDQVNSSYIQNRLENQARIEEIALPATAKYTIRIVNFVFNSYGFNDNTYTVFSNNGRGGIGIYTLYIGCTFRDGTVINPGDTQLNVQQPPISNSNAIIIPNMTNTAKIPLPITTPMLGAVTPTGGEILGYTLDAAANDVLDLTFTRLSGNLNLGLVVLSAENQVVFQASLVTSSTLNTRLTLPTAGTYTIGVYRIDLLPPASPEATAFQIQATLNP